MFIKTLFIVFIFLFFDNSANAVAWLRKKGELITIHSLEIVDQVNSNLYNYNTVGNSHVTGFDYHLYAEYGATNRITIGTNSILESYTTSENKSGAAIKLTEYFARYGLFYTQNRSMVLTTQFLYKPPSIYDSSVNINSAIYGGTDQHDIESLMQLLVNVNTNEDFFGFTPFYKQLLNIEFGYRQRFNLDFNEVRLNIQYMFWFDKSNAILLGFYKTMRIYNQLNGYPVNFTQQISWVKNDQNTLDISWVFFSNEKEATSIGFFADMYGLPFGNGDANLSTFGAKLAFWFL